MIGKKNKSNPNQKKLFVKILSKEVVDGKEVKIVPNKFQISEKVGDEYKPREKTAQNITGDLVHIILDTYEWQGEEKNVVKFYLEDNSVEEVCIIDARLNNLTRGIFNSFFALKSFKNIEVSLFSTKDKSGVEWPAASVWQDGERVMWKFKPEEQPTVKKLLDSRGKTKGQDSFELDAFYVENLTELAARVKTARSTSTPASTNDAVVQAVKDLANLAKEAGVSPVPIAEASASPKSVRVGKKTVKVTVPVEPTSDSDENVDTDSIPF